jgi:hypothetical protein
MAAFAASERLKKNSESLKIDTTANTTKLISTI